MDKSAAPAQDGAPPTVKRMIVQTALSLAEYAAYAAALGLILSLVGLAVALRRRAGRGIVLGLLGLVAALPVVAMAAQRE